MVWFLRGLGFPTLPVGLKTFEQYNNRGIGGYNDAAVIHFLAFLWIIATGSSAWGQTLALRTDKWIYLVCFFC
jgi:hypothetical protein